MLSAGVCSVASPNVEVSDTMDDDSSTVAGKKNPDQ